ncbi:hypothetical protein E1B28_013061 [Marasmius oreades]|uniref:Uncharacterized protein n=1 Tax=Marasmius oreades TaxID=181124 RepID=A0A9P7UPI1_9AGAR|nr:uncharacterized protein E1B28_013061 [Marasmius oreades]KAG7087079.1 hypothetical protein E1B28_013061 [Marasmius oreades]
MYRLTYLTSEHKDLFHKDSSVFYCVVTDEWMEKWGTLSLDIQPKDADPDTFKLAELNNIADLEEQNKELARRSEFQRVCSLHVGAWARHKWGSKSTDTSAVTAVL